MYLSIFVAKYMQIKVLSEVLHRFMIDSRHYSSWDSFQLKEYLTREYIDRGYRGGTVLQIGQYNG